MSNVTVWRHRKKGIPVDEIRDYARLQSFDFEAVFSELDWDETSIAKIKKKTEFVEFARRCSLGEPPYSVAKSMDLSESTVYPWINKLIKLLEFVKNGKTKG